MALVRKDSVRDTTATTGTGTLTIAGSAPAGNRTIASAHSTGDTIRVRIETSDRTEWEDVEGVWTTSGATLTRVTVYASSNAGSLVNFSAGTKSVIEVPMAIDFDGGAGAGNAYAWFLS